MSERPTPAWSPLDAVAFGWRRLKADPKGVFFPLLIGAVVVSVLPISGAIYQLQLEAAGGDTVSVRAGLARMAFSVANLPVQAFVGAGLLDFVLRVARRQRYGIADLVGGKRWFVSMLGVHVVIYVSVMLGLMLFLVPGLIIFTALCMAPALVVDRDLDAMDALKESLVITEGQRLRIFAFGLLAGALVLVGYAALCVGSYVAGAVGVLGFGWVYLQVSGENVAG